MQSTFHSVGSRQCDSISLTVFRPEKITAET